jgi:CDP-diacylglycerol--glycerol-3-phosphate 3-phosphatidyltransferase
LPPFERLANVPNFLSLSRVPLGVALFVCIAHTAWLSGLIVFVVATATDWLDGWWARRYGPLTLVGRNLDPMTDKVLICGAFIYLIPVLGAGIDPWMVTVVVGRELVVTGIRGIVESTGRKFGADWFGKLKMGLQCAVLIGVLLILWLGTVEGAEPLVGVLAPIQLVLLWAMLGATLGSGIQYLVKANRLIRT